jgi:hypothetical protein
VQQVENVIHDAAKKARREIIQPARERRLITVVIPIDPSKL